MSYSNIEDLKIPFYRRIKNKLLLCFVGFPLNKVRVAALRGCSFIVGNEVYIGGGLMLASVLGDKRCELFIGNRVAFGPRVTVILASDANWSRLNSIIKPIRGKVVIEDDCWIGANVTILPNVSIGQCSVIGAGSVITKDVPPYSVVVGVPGKVLRTIKHESK